MKNKQVARGIKWVDRKYPSPDKVIALFEFENKSIGSFNYSSMSYKQEISYMVHYENYTLTFENGLEIWYRPAHRSQREGETLTAQPGKQGKWVDCRPNYVAQIGPDKYEFAVNQNTALIMTDFLDAVRNNTPMKVTIEDGYKVAELAEAIEMSYTRNKKIELPLRFKSPELHGHVGRQGRMEKIQS